MGLLVGSSGRVDARLGVTRGRLGAVGFTGDVGSAYNSADGDGSVRVAIGVGHPASADPAAVRDAAGAFGRASGQRDELAVIVPKLAGITVEEAARAVVEGVLLSRYRHQAGGSGGGARAVAPPHGRGVRQGEMGCGGLLGANAASSEPPRTIKLSYRPRGPGDGAL